MTGPAARTPVSYRALQAWARSAVAVVYRRIEVTAAAPVPTGRPLILAANHGNALADIAILVAKMPRFPQFLAAASWWKSPPARLLFHLGGVVPIHRRRDGHDMQQNTSTFEACHAALAHGAAVAIFPEGEMHLEPGLLPLRTGAARIALGAAADAKVAGIAIVPVALLYEERGRFRSDAEIRFGDAIEIDDWVEHYRTDAQDAVRVLTDLLAARLAAASVNHDSHTEANVIDRAAAFALADDAAEAGGTASFADRNALRRVLARRVADAGGASSAAYHDLARAVAAHGRDLDELGGDRRDIAPMLAETPDTMRRRLRAELSALTAPAALGAVANAPMLLVVAVGARRVRSDAWQATVKGVAGTFLAPALWAVEYAVLARRIGRRTAFALTAAGAGCGLAALAWHDRWRRRRAIVWRDRAAREHPAQFAQARASRDALREQVTSLGQ